MTSKAIVKATVNNSTHNVSTQAELVPPRSEELLFMALPVSTQAPKPKSTDKEIEGVTVASRVDDELDQRVDNQQDLDQTPHKALPESSSEEVAQKEEVGQAAEESSASSADLIEQTAASIEASEANVLDFLFAQVGGAATGAVGSAGAAVMTDAAVGVAVGQVTGGVAAAGAVSSATVAAAGVGVAAAAGGGGGGGGGDSSQESSSSSGSAVALLSSYSDEVRQANSFDLYQFDIANGQVVAVREYENGRWVTDPISSYESYSVNGANVTKTENYGSYVETTTYTDADGDGVFIESGDSFTSSLNTNSISNLRSTYYDDDYDDDDDEYEGGRYDDDDGFSLTGILDDRDNDNLFERGESLDLYRFDIANGQVVGVQEFDDGRWQIERIDSDESYIFTNGQVTKTEMDDGYRELTIYRDLDGDGIFSEFSKSYEFIA